MHFLSKTDKVTSEIFIKSFARSSSHTFTSQATHVWVNKSISYWHRVCDIYRCPTTVLHSCENPKTALIYRPRQINLLYSVKYVAYTPWQREPLRLSPRRLTATIYQYIFHDGMRDMKLLCIVTDFAVHGIRAVFINISSRLCVSQCNARLSYSNGKQQITCE